MEEEEDAAVVGEIIEIEEEIEEVAMIEIEEVTGVTEEEEEGIGVID